MRLASLTAAALLLAAASAHAATSVQSVPFNFSETDTISDANFPSPNFFTATVSPFNPALGTLNSFTIDWSITATADLTAGAFGGGGSLSGGGDYQVNGRTYDNNGGSVGDGTADSGGIVHLSLPVTKSTTFLPANAGVTYDPAILDAVQGTSTFPLFWTATFDLTTGQITSWTAGATGSVTLTYDYTAAIPEPASLLLAALAAPALLLKRRRRVA